MSAYTVTVTIFDIDPAQFDRAAQICPPSAVCAHTPISWQHEPEFRQAVGEFDARGDGRSDVQDILEHVAGALNAGALAGSRPITFEVHSIDRFGGHFGWAYTPAGYCRGCGQRDGAIDERGYHAGCRPASRDRARALADTRVLGLSS